MMRKTLTILLLVLAQAVDPATAAKEKVTASDAEGGPNPAVSYQAQVRQMLPVLHWSFEGECPEIGEAAGKVAFGKAGPGPKDFKSFGTENRAALFGPADGFLRVEDVGPGSQFDFDNGDPITIEAWVNPGVVGRGNNMYIVGKGRTNNPGFARDNQNWGLRLWEGGGYLRLSWLFRSRAEKDVQSEWHRWTSRGGIKAESGWHHVALSYEFGKPQSVKGYIDGEPFVGAWDMGGKTKRPPVVDDDEVWVGNSIGGHANVSFKGLLDEVAVYRRVLSEEQLAQRYPVVPYVPVVEESTLPAKGVRVEVVEGLSGARRWPRRFSEPAEVYEEDAFGFFQLPRKYTRNAVRTERSNPYLLRAIAKVVLEEGENRILLRTRGGGRLWMDGEQIAETEFPYPRGGGHHEVLELAEKPAANLRRVAMGDREHLVNLEGDGEPHVFVLEMMAGNGKVRSTLGETTVSLSHDGRDFTLLSPSREVILTDEGWSAYRREREDYHARIDAARRAEAREKGEANYWERRHAWAREVIEERGAPALPGADTVEDFPVSNEVDQFLAAAWSKAQAEAAASKAAGGVDFESDVQPILADRCFRCHAEKSKGGLRLDSREAALKGGESELAAVVPGEPAKSFLLEMIDPEKAGEDRMPPKGDPLNEKEREVLREWIAQGAAWSAGVGEVELTESTSDLEFLRRATLDIAGVVPSLQEIADYMGDERPGRRARAIDRLLADDRWADHWVSYWQDVLAENPNILKPNLNNSGPFRFWIYESLLDNVAMDQFVTELVMMEGSSSAGGPAGFGVATQNDVPMAAKAHILGTAFLGVEMKCARCHDAPYHSSVQKDLFQLAAMLNRETMTLPESSTVPATTFAGREPLISITLKPGEEIEPAWPFKEFSKGEPQDWALRNEGDTREELAVLLTSPRNERFGQVIVNRVWKRLMGAGFVDPVDDWEASKPLYPELLDWLAAEFVTSGYDLKAVARTIMNSHAYQRKARPLPAGDMATFAAPVQRRMGAEQVVDSMLLAVGKVMDTEELTFDADGTQPAKNMLSFGYPRRAWEFTSLSNERERPSLALPKAQAVVDALTNFGWRISRQGPKSVRDSTPNVRQPAILANGTLGRRAVTLSEDGGITALATREDAAVNELINSVFLRVLTRKPTAGERELYTGLLSEGFEGRIIPEKDRSAPVAWKPLPRVSWSNHFSSEANRIMLEMEKRASVGDPPTAKLRPTWRERMEDMLWAVLNSPEFVYLP